MIVGATELNKRLRKMSKMNLKKGVGEAISFVQAAAKLNCPVDDGELRQSIYTSVEESGTTVTGTCFTLKKHGPFVEFGTGPKGQADHEGISPDVAVAYTQSPWWIHESQIDRSTAEKYHFLAIETKDGTFYRCAGQAAQPFMYPALKDNEDEIVNIVARAVRSRL